MSEKPSVRFRAYNIITNAIEQGIEYGYNRAHKHTATPDAHSIKNEIYNAITNELCEILEFAPFSEDEEDDCSARETAAN